MKSISTSGAVLLLASCAGAISLKTDDEASIRSTAQQYAYGLLASYPGNASGLAPEAVGSWPKPVYWWESGAIWGGLVEYTQITGDTSFVKTVQQGLVANYGPKNDFIMPSKTDQEGNDDQAFWCLATMSAVEYGFPEPDQAPVSYLQATQNCFENIMSRWDETSCGGGLRWQIYAENAYGYDYKNAISNGGAFALAARLARATGQQKYADWANKIYDWTKKVGLIGDQYEVYDGSDSKTNCATVGDKTEWTYNNAMFLHGSAFMYDYTKGDSTWKDRTAGFLNRAATFFNNPKQAVNVMFEACENGSKGCNLDQQSFKAYLARWMAKTAILAPFTKEKVVTYLTASANAAAQACSGGSDGKTCGSKWYTGGFDGQMGIGQQLSALEVTQALLMINKNTLPGTSSNPPPAKSSASPSSSATPSASAATPSTPSSAIVTPAVTTPAAITSSPQSTAPGGLFGEFKPSGTPDSCSSRATVTTYVTASPPSPSTCSSRATVTTYVTAPPPSSSACSLFSTVTVYAPPSAPSAPVSSPKAPPPPPSSTTVKPASPPPATTTTAASVSPPKNTSSPVQFPGAASSNVKLAGSTVAAAAALAALAALL